MLFRTSLFVAALAVAAAACSQTVFSRPQMRDYDQRRNGLANNGDMHCVPTSYVNLFKYMAAYGMPGMDGSYGNGHTDITNFIFITGFGMGTDSAGTVFEAAWNSSILWVNYNTSKLVYHWGYGADWDWGINKIRNAVRSGSLVKIGYGRYIFNVNRSHWERYSGHAVVVSGYDWSNSNQRKIVVNDPATDDGNLGTQGSFTFETKDTSNITLTTEEHGVVTHARYTNWTGDSGNRRAVVDSMHQMLPVFAGWPADGRATEIVTVTPWIFPDTSSTEIPREIRYRTAQPAVSWCYDLGEIAFFYATARGDVIRVDPLERTETTVATFTDDVADMVVGGSTMDLYILTKGLFQDKINLLDMDSLRLSSRTLPIRTNLLDFDSKFGGPAMFDTAGSSIVTYSEDLRARRRQNLADSVPGRFAIAGTTLFKIDHNTGDALVVDQGGRTITRYVGDGPVRFARQTTLRGLNRGITEMMPVDQGLIVIQDGNLLKTYNAVGAAVSTQLTNVVTTGPFKMARSMFAAKPGTMRGPKWANVLPVGNEP
jgi:hypothetical protein